MAPSALIPINIGLEGLGSEGLMDATSNLGPSGVGWAKFKPSARHAQAANFFIPAILSDPNRGWCCRSAGLSPARLRHYVDQYRLALLHSLDSALERRCEIIRVADRTLGVQAVALRDVL